MKMTKKTAVGGAFARKEAYEYEGTQYEADIKDGDKVKFTNGGTVTEGTYGEQHVFGIETRNGEKNIALNQKSINTLVDEYGEESEEWKGKEVNVLLKKDVIAGKRVVIAYLVPDGWYLDDFGDLVKEGQEQEVTPEDVQI